MVLSVPHKTYDEWVAIFSTFEFRHLLDQRVNATHNRRICGDVWVRALEDTLHAQWSNGEH